MHITALRASALRCSSTSNSRCRRSKHQALKTAAAAAAAAAAAVGDNTRPTSWMLGWLPAVSIEQGARLLLGVFLPEDGAERGGVGARLLRCVISRSSSRSRF